jgi:GT2 family glycosyltransferase
MDTPLIDVLIPVFNAAETVRQAIASIQQQTVRDIRIVVVTARPIRLRQFSPTSREPTREFP